MNYIVCAFHTDDPLYNDHAKEFEASLKTVGISQYHIEVIPPIDKWVSACAQKADFLLSRMRRTDRDILYVDIDARFRQFPELFDHFPYDIGAHIKDNSELLSGTLYLRNNHKVKSLLKAWKKNQRCNPEMWDQRVLQNTVNELAHLDLKLGNLPAAYCMIFDSMAHLGEPVIEHLQASRQHPDKQPVPLISLDASSREKLTSGEVLVVNIADGQRVAVKFV